MKAINDWISRGLLNVNPSIARAPDPICAACQFGKAHKKPHSAAMGCISEAHKTPGAGVSADQLKAGIPGRIFSTRGLPSPKRFRFTNLWVDHYLWFIFVTFHETQGSQRTVELKAGIRIL
jgi:hypothetical protein